MKQGQTYAARRGDGSIEERTTKGGEPRWLARWHDGVRVRSKTFRSLEAAEAHIQSVGRARRAGRYIPDDQRTVTEVVEAYIASGPLRRDWRANTVATYTTILKNDITPAIGSIKVTELTGTRCQHFIDALARKYSPARVELIRAVIGGALKEQMMLDVIPKNPMSGVRMPKKQDAEEFVIWSDEEIAAVMRASKPDPQLHAYYAVALTTGMRPGEQRALRWTDIDLDNGEITVRTTMTRDENYRPVIGTKTKTGVSKVVGIPPQTVAALKRYRASQAARKLRADRWVQDDVVFDRGDGRPIPQQTFARRHVRICELAGVEKITPHGMRHTAATKLLEAGMDIKVVSDMLGHRDTATTRDIYQHVKKKLKSRAAETLGALLEDQASGD